MERKTLKLALEVLQFNGNIWHMDCKKDVAITAIKEALAQPAQEPQVCCGEYDTCLRACTPRGRHLAHPEQEPVAWTLLLTGEHTGMVGKAGEKFVGAPDYYQRVNVYTTPAQRPWVDLTDEECREIFNAIKAKLKEKNT